jgi:hypothetical protein
MEISKYPNIVHDLDSIQDRQQVHVKDSNRA